MRISYPVIRGGPMLAVLALLVGAASAHAAGKTTAHRYTIQGSLQAAATSTNADGASMQMTSHLSAPAQDVALQSGGNFVVMAKLAYSPLTCFGDTIFRDGFDGNGI
ncbi:MAG TPA: hypothetical protein VGC55_18595 [Dokdonella sp.]